MRQPRKTERSFGALVAVLIGLCANPAAHAAQPIAGVDASRLTADSWQTLKRADKDGGSTAQVPVQGTPSPIDAAKSAGSTTVTSTPATGSAASFTQAGTFRLVKGELLQLQLQKWAARADWTISWNVPDSWIVPGDKDYGTDFENAVKRAVEELASNGADVVGDSWRGNRTIIITQNGVMQ